MEPAIARQNLKVEINAHATKIILRNKQARGIRYYQNGVNKDVYARKEVILSAGAVQSPQILELSGIGNPEILKHHGIEIVNALTGVGENYRDHYIVRQIWKVKKKITLNEQTRGLFLVKEFFRYAFSNSGILTFPGGILAGYVRTRPELASPDIQYTIVHASFKDVKRRVFDSHPGVTIAPCQLRPESRGSIHIKSSDPMIAPAIRGNFLSELNDQKTIISGMKIAREIAASPVLKTYIGEELEPGTEIFLDEDWLDFARTKGNTVYHPVGTCKMGRDKESVVDDNLKVLGVERLRVIDASIMPTLVSGNTNAPTIMIAEKGADLIKKDGR